MSPQVAQPQLSIDPNIQKAVQAYTPEQKFQRYQELKRKQQAIGQR